MSHNLHTIWEIGVFSLKINVFIRENMVEAADSQRRRNNGILKHGFWREKCRERGREGVQSNLNKKKSVNYSLDPHEDFIRA